MNGILQWWWWQSRTSQPFVPPMRLLQLSDFVRTGRGIVEVLALFTAGSELYDPGRGHGSIADPASDLTLDGQNTTISRVYRQSVSALTFFQSGGSSWSAAFEGSGDFTDGTVYVQTLTDLVALPVATTLADAGFTFLRFTVPAADRAAIAGIADGDRFLVAMTRPVPVSDRLEWGADRLEWGSDELRWAA